MSRRKKKQGAENSEPISAPLFLESPTEAEPSEASTQESFVDVASSLQIPISVSAVCEATKKLRTVSLSPGVNRVRGDLWLLVKGAAIVEDLVSCGRLRVDTN